MWEYFFKHPPKPPKNTKHSVRFIPQHESAVPHDHAHFKQLLLKYKDVPPDSGIELKPSRTVQNPDCSDTNPDIKAEDM